MQNKMVSTKKFKCKSM